MFLRTSKLCCPGAKPRRWAPPLVTRLVVFLSTKRLLRDMRCQTQHDYITRPLIEETKNVKMSLWKLGKEPHAAREPRRIVLTDLQQDISTKLSSFSRKMIRTVSLCLIKKTKMQQDLHCANGESKSSKY